MQIIDNGNGNVVKADDTYDVTITFDGDDNTVIIEKGCSLVGASIRLVNKSTFNAGKGCRLYNLEIFGNESYIEIGDLCQFTWHTRIYAHEPSRIVLGKSCLIASDTILMSSDVHRIFDRETNQRINPAKNIVLGDRVWLADRVSVYKGATIGSDSVIGAGSIVNCEIPPNCVAAGVPAKVVRTNIRWEP